MPNIEVLIEQIIAKMKIGGRLFYIGAGTSGRLGVVDASECPPTYGVAFDRVIGLIAGGDGAIRKAVENAEDDEKQGWKDLKAYKIQFSQQVSKHQQRPVHFSNLLLFKLKSNQLPFLPTTNKKYLNLSFHQ